MKDQILNMDGYTDIPSGKIAYVVTFLEMLRAPDISPPQMREDVVLQRWSNPDPEEYLKLFRMVGEDWIWFGRLQMSPEKLKSVLSEPARENYLPMRGGKPIGTLELDFADPENPELSYFGLAPGAIGGGLGRWLMSEAMRIAWSRPETKRVWVHTCTGDSPAALKFYLANGFVPYKRSIEVADDPRLTGLLPKHVGPHVPVIG